MRSLILVGALALAACATTPPSPPVEPAQTAATEPTQTQTAPRSPLAVMLGSAGSANAADLSTIERAFGAADVRRQEGAGAMLTYRTDTCALLLVFTADARNTLRLAEAHAQARRAGAAAPSLDQCAAEIATRGAHPPA